MSKELFPIGDVRGMTGQQIRLMMNELVGQATCYLEVGLYCGLSFTSAMYGNRHIRRAIGIDSWAEFRHGGRVDPRKEFYAAVAKYYPKEVPLTLFEQDCWTVQALPDKPDLYYYDGDHSALSQERALTHFGPMCAEYFTFCCDDWNWAKVREGTRKALQRFEVLDEFEKILPFAPGSIDTKDGEWWNGFAVFKLRQK